MGITKSSNVRFAVSLKRKNNKMKNNDNIQDQISRVSEKLESIIDTMAMHSKITVRDLADKVSMQIPEMTHSQVMNLVSLCAHNSKSVCVELGRGGGIYKGGRAKKIDARTRCESCHQVVRAKTTPDAEETSL